MGNVFRVDVGEVPEYIKDASAASIGRLKRTGQLPCGNTFVECYPGGAAIRGACGCTTLTRFIFMPPALNIRERQLHPRWGPQQTFPLESLQVGHSN